jgi:hypothetical protein
LKSKGLCRLMLTRPAMPPSIRSALLVL